ncbi:hypothetical protein [Yinghuangia seranimata]|nr:hypothetical protein [Yinghuangia seranimata]MDI2124948.1 hypothetical protein [Yinghuangia seranimata]
MPAPASSCRHVWRNVADGKYQKCSKCKGTVPTDAEGVGEGPFGP